MKRERRGRTRHSGQAKPSRTGTQSSLVPGPTVVHRVSHRRGHLYNPKVPAQHLKIDDPNLIFVSATTPIQRSVKYILTRINAVSQANAEIVEKHTNQTQDPVLQTVVIAGTNSAISTVVSIIEIIKRRCPSLMYNMQIGTVDNSVRIATAQAAATTEMNQDEPADVAPPGQTEAPPSTPATNTVPAFPVVAYGIRVTLLVQDAVDIQVT